MPQADIFWNALWKYVFVVSSFSTVKHVNVAICHLWMWFERMNYSCWNIQLLKLLDASEVVFFKLKNVLLLLWFFSCFFFFFKVKATKYHLHCHCLLYLNLLFSFFITHRNSRGFFYDKFDFSILSFEK